MTQMVYDVFVDPTSAGLGLGAATNPAIGVYEGLRFRIKHAIRRFCPIVDPTGGRP